MGRQWQRILQQINKIMREKIIQKCIQDIMKKSTSKIQVEKTQLKAWFQYQKVCILKNQMIVHVKSSTYIESVKENNDKGSKFKIGDIVKIIRYKNIFQKVTFQLYLKKFL